MQTSTSVIEKLYVKFAGIQLNQLILMSYVNFAILSLSGIFRDVALTRVEKGIWIIGLSIDVISIFFGLLYMKLIISYMQKIITKQQPLKNKDKFFINMYGWYLTIIIVSINLTFILSGWLAM